MLNQEQRLKYEIAEELGLLEKLKQVGWAGLSAAESGRIGGMTWQNFLFIIKNTDQR